MTKQNDNILIAGLYLVATPIGNLGDFSSRAVRTLKDVDVIACEDTRVSRVLLNHYQIDKKLISYHDHNAEKVIPFITDSIKDGKKVALISDAGAPLVSDPGYKLVKACREQGLYVTSVPGASALVTALQLSGLSPFHFSFLGFFPQKKSEREKILEQAAGGGEMTAIFYESPNRLLDSLRFIQSQLGEIRVCVARELTKKFEEVTTDAIANVIAHYEAKDSVKGEIVLLCEMRPEKREVTPELLREELLRAMASMDKKESVAHVAKTLGIKKSIVYDEAVKIPIKT